jgi:hypothetical protein
MLPSMVKQSPVACLQELAQQFGLYPEVAASRAAYWRALAPPTSAIVESARHVCAALQQRKVCSGTCCPVHATVLYCRFPQQTRCAVLCLQQ